AGALLRDELRGVPASVLRPRLAEVPPGEHPPIDDRRAASASSWPTRLSDPTMCPVRRGERGQRARDPMPQTSRDGRFFIEKEVEQQQTAIHLDVFTRWRVRSVERMESRIYQ